MATASTNSRNPSSAYIPTNGKTTTIVNTPLQLKGKVNLSASITANNVRVTPTMFSKLQWLDIGSSLSTLLSSIGSFDLSEYYKNTEVATLIATCAKLSSANTFSGVNNFTNILNTIQASTQSTTNSSNNVATTAFVQKQTGFTTLLYSGNVTIPLQTTMKIFIHYTGSSGVGYIGIGSHQTPEYKGQTYVVTSFSTKTVVFYPGGSGSFVLGGGTRTDIASGISVGSYSTKTFIYTADPVHSWIYF